MPSALSVIFQAAKLGDRAPLLAEFEWALELLQRREPLDRIYGVSGGALAALGTALALSARRDPGRWGGADGAPAEFSHFLRRAGHWQIHSLNLLPRFGFYNLRPLRRWLAARLVDYVGRADLNLSELAAPLYLVTLDAGGLFTLFGPPDDGLQFDYFFRQTGPPRDAPLLDAVIAALSTSIATEPGPANGAWFRDTRPALADAAALITD